MRTQTTTVAFTVLLALAGCEQKSAIHWDGISSFRVTITSGDPGTEQDPIPPAAAGTPFEIDIQAINGRGEPMNWSDEVFLKAAPGRLEGVSDTRAFLVNGAGTASLVVGRAFGPTRVWVEDVGTDEAPGSYATGLTETIWFQGLRI